MPNSSKLPTYYSHADGFIMPHGFPRENYASALNYHPDPGDIFVCTYPKCGTTWTQCILQLLADNGVPLKPGQSVNDFIPHLEEVGADYVTALPKPRVIKTHLPRSLTPLSPAAKYIVIARNPKDCCVSFYHHTRGFPKYYDFLDGKFDDYFEIFLKGEVDFGDYFDHLLSWIPYKDDENVLFLLYEKLKCDPASCIKSIGEFLGGPFLAACEKVEVFDRVLQNSSFESMKKTPDFWSSGRPQGQEEFIRKGSIGDWRNYFSADQSQRLDAKFRAKFNETDAEHLWEEFDC